ncbi:SDR family NAD(P)-dependent oxidoreductase [Shewanella waksmanii]|uniref:SDR family NAD(P)-dependent oxidoreductase n=1 Tax=Shewanella waksmanii TaxID=213783 RepID=UPI0037364148
MIDKQRPWVLITGASSGIGKACAEVFAGLNYNLLLVSRDLSALEQVKNNALSKGAADVCCFVVDLGSHSEVKQLFVDIIKYTRVLDIVVNCAGIMRPQPLLMTQSQLVEEQFNVNSFAPLWICQQASKLMIRQRRGAIVQVSSAVAQQGAKGQAAYAASKAAVEGLTKSLAKELAPLGIRVNCVRPGIIDTNLLSNIDSEERQATVKKVGLGRVGEAKEVAEGIVYLAHAEYVTGHILNIDGGLHL